ncbi:MAG: cysteine rich repeat-containing protein [Alphaproteobacteria bacterium]|nr:cysteine rich repeat-containing protein [Alphaproteobacteria bacterium]
MPRFLLIALALLSVSLPTAGFAQQRGTADEQEACRRDVQKHCRAVIDQGDFAILACLKENRTRISKACQQVLINNNQ